jgi:hypothetical protein
MSHFNPSFIAGMSPMARRDLKRWNSVNTPSGLSGQKLDDEIIDKMTRVVYLHYKVSYNGAYMPPEPGSSPVMADVLDAVVKTMEVFVLEKEEEFKFGKGKKVVAIADGGKNFANNTVKYVKWFNLYDTPDRQDGKSTIKVLEKTYTYGIEKARVFWDEKIKEGYNRVV